ncbi:MAG: hypothetical protein U0263_41550 [Polyangiaceae bacterium]
MLPIFINGMTSHFVSECRSTFDGTGPPIIIAIGAPVDFGTLLDADPQRLRAQVAVGGARAGRTAKLAELEGASRRAHLARRLSWRRGKSGAGRHLAAAGAGALSSRGDETIGRAGAVLLILALGPARRRKPARPRAFRRRAPVLGPSPGGERRRRPPHRPASQGYVAAHAAGVTHLGTGGDVVLLVETGTKRALPIFIGAPSLGRSALRLDKVLQAPACSMTSS